MKIVLFANTDWYLYNFRLPLVRALRAGGSDILLLSPAGEYATRLQKEGVRWREFPMSRKGMNPLSELATLLKLIRVYRQEKPDLVHHFTVKCVVYGSIAGHLAGIPHIINSITGLGYIFATDSSRKWLQVLVKFMYRLCLRGTRTIFQNEEDRQIFLKSRIIKPDCSHLIRGSGVDTEVFTPTPEPPGMPVVMLPTRMLWEKGVGEFVEAARLLKQQAANARFALVGNTYIDNPTAVPAAQLQKWHDEGIIEWWGWSDEMNVVISRSSIICLPSYYREGLPKILTEAAACGRPIITTDSPGCRDVVRDGINGLLIKLKDVNGLVQAINFLLTNPDIRHKMGAAGRSLAVELFSADRIVKETLAIYPDTGLKDVKS